MDPPASIKGNSSGKTLTDKLSELSESLLSQTPLKINETPSTTGSASVPSLSASAILDHQVESDALIDQLSKYTLDLAISSPEGVNLTSSLTLSGSLAQASTSSAPKASRHKGRMAEEKKKVKEARNKHLEEDMPKAQEASRRLQRALEIFDDEPWPIPSSAPQISKNLSKSNAFNLRSTLNICENFAVDMNRKSEDRAFLDDTILKLYDEKHLDTAKPEEVEEVDINEAYPIDQPKYHRLEDTPDTMMTDIDWDVTPKAANTLQMTVGGEHANKESSTQEEIFATQTSSPHQVTTGSDDTPKAFGIHEDYATPKNFHHEADFSNTFGNIKEKESNTTTAATVKKYLTSLNTPDLTKMPGTFTSAICHQREFLVIPVLAISLIATTPPMHSPKARSRVLLAHFEVGLDGVEALCQGQVTIYESSNWKREVREKRVGKLGTVKTGKGGHSERLEEEQTRRGMGKGDWFFWGIRFRQSGKERKKGKEGKWACFGLPVEATSCPKRLETCTAVVGGGVDNAGNEVEKFPATMKRTTLRLSTGGVACMDLWQGGEQWEDGLWGKVRQSMAHNGLETITLYPDPIGAIWTPEIAAARKAKTEVKAGTSTGAGLEEEVVEGKGKGKGKA